MGNVADGLAAIQRFIFDERNLTWQELNQALRDDFEGHEPAQSKRLFKQANRCAVASGCRRRGDPGDAPTRDHHIPGAGNR